MRNESKASTARLLVDYSRATFGSERARTASTSMRPPRNKFELRIISFVGLGGINLNGCSTSARTKVRYGAAPTPEFEANSPRKRHSTCGSDNPSPPGVVIRPTCGDALEGSQ